MTFKTKDAPQPQGAEVAAWVKADPKWHPEKALYALAHMKAERDALLEAAYSAGNKMRELGSQFPGANCAKEFIALRAAIKNAGGHL